MTPRRKAWLLVAVLGVAAVWLVHSLWYTIAYIEKPMPAKKTQSGYGMVFLEKRYSWLPGPSHVLPDQPCEICTNAHHHICLNTYRCNTGSLAATNRQAQVPTNAADRAFDQL